MFIKNLRMSRLMEADNGAGGGANTGNAETTETKTDTQETTQEEKAFTQADVDRLIQDRIAREKKGIPSKEDLKVYQEWKDSQKTEEEKKNEALTNAEKARIAAEEKATSLEAKVTCLSKGVVDTSVDDVVVLAKAMVTEEVTMEEAIDKVLQKYPSFKVGQQQQQEQNKGFKIGVDGTPQNGDANNQLASIFGNDTK